MHVHDLMPFHTNLFNMSHTIAKLSFGTANSITHSSVPVPAASSATHFTNACHAIRRITDPDVLN
jgi:hypothetical protein